MNKVIQSPKKVINQAVAWTIIVIATAGFLCLLFVVRGQMIATQTDQARRVANIQAQNDSVRWLRIPGAKHLMVVPTDNQYKNIDSTWFLVNKNHALAANYVPADLVTPNVTRAANNDDPSMQVRQQVADQLSILFTTAASNGHVLTIRSSYRNYATQQNYYAQALNRGTTDYVAQPGQSEHQTGLAVDVNNLTPNCGGCDIDNATAIWLKDNAYKYGFIVRYQAGKESITGYKAEPWHLRYVGALLATKLQESGLTLEELTQLFDKKRQ